MKQDIAEFCRKLQLAEDIYDKYDEDERWSEIEVTTPPSKAFSFQKHYTFPNKARLLSSEEYHHKGTQMNIRSLYH
ncbi:Hypothetical predicted protein [Octopus vulgaris]|uniref:Uncharacterized protein n=1 Tax=Octopus vulgaris TaxID=6645 RepID=A0AA36AW98_OCTVU|nr:Hypothetical predicted protein [Octopus vulgaris]